MSRTKIISLEEFGKKLNESFYNPFEEEDKFKKKDPIQVKDFGGFFKLKKSFLYSCLDTDGN